MGERRRRRLPMEMVRHAGDGAHGPRPEAHLRRRNGLAALAERAVESGLSAQHTKELFEDVFRRWAWAAQSLRTGRAEDIPNLPALLDEAEACKLAPVVEMPRRTPATAATTRSTRPWRRTSATCASPPSNSTRAASRSSTRRAARRRAHRLSFVNWIAQLGGRTFRQISRSHPTHSLLERDRRNACVALPRGEGVGAGAREDRAIELARLGDAPSGSVPRRTPGST